MNIESAFVLVLIGALLAQIVYEYFALDCRCTGRPAYEKHTGIQKSVFKVFLPILPFIALPIFSLWMGDVFEYSKDFQMLISIFLLALIAGPAIVYAYFGNFKAAALGFAIRGLILILIFKIGW